MLQTAVQIRVTVDINLQGSVARCS